MSTLNEKKILITAGSTRGYLDAVRFISNTSTGRLSSEIALEALDHGACVTYVYGKDSVFPETEDRSDISPDLLELIEIETNRELENTIQETLKYHNFDAIVHAMAVSDYVPKERSPNKISSEKDELIIKLIKTRKVINMMRNVWPDSYLVGFKLVTGKSEEEMLHIAQDFLRKCGADLIISNDSQEISDKDHIAYFVSSTLEKRDKFYNKKEIAKALLRHLELHIG